MDKHEPDLVERPHREAVQRCREQKDKERTQGQALFREAREAQRPEGKC